METSQMEVNQSSQPEPSKEPSMAQTSVTAQTKGLLSEARNTRDVLVGFRAAVESGTFHGSKMMDVAKGMAFLEAILNQNQAHIKSLQERLDK